MLTVLSSNSFVQESESSTFNFCGCSPQVPWAWPTELPQPLLAGKRQKEPFDSICKGSDLASITMASLFRFLQGVVDKSRDEHESVK